MTTFMTDITKFGIKSDAWQVEFMGLITEVVWPLMQELRTAGGGKECFHSLMISLMMILVLVRVVMNINLLCRRSDRFCFADIRNSYEHQNTARGKCSGPVLAPTDCPQENRPCSHLVMIMEIPV